MKDSEKETILYYVVGWIVLLIL